MNDRFTDSVVEQASLAWLGDAGGRIAFCPDIALSMPAAKPANYVDLVLAQRRRDALLPRLNSGELSIEVAEDSIERVLA